MRRLFVLLIAAAALFAAAGLLLARGNGEAADGGGSAGFPPTETVTETPTITVTRTNTPTVTPSPTVSPTVTATPTPTPTPQPNDDEDGDGIAHSIDTLPKLYSENFSDVYLGGTTFGTIFHAPGMTLSVSDAPFPDGVRVVGSGTGGPAPVVAFCSPKFRTYISPASDETITCASADVHMNAGSAVTWFGTLISKLTSGADVRVTEPSTGVYNVMNNGASGVTVGGVAIASGGSANDLADTDQDGLANSAETSLVGSNPSVSDSDGDGLADGLEFVLYLTNPVDADTDTDGCGDGRELGPNQRVGGLRDPLNPYDYFDVYGQMQNPVKDKKIDVPNDILPVILAYSQGPNDPGRNGIPGPNYSTAKDRGHAVMGALYAWQRTGPDGHVDVPNDILPIILQYLHSCT